MTRSRELLALPTVRDIGELIRNIFEHSGVPVRLPAEREPPADALERSRGDVAGCLLCCDHPPRVLDDLARRAAEVRLPVILFSSRLRADEVRRVAGRLTLPWVDLTQEPDAIVGAVQRVLEPSPARAPRHS